MTYPALKQTSTLQRAMKMDEMNPPPTQHLLWKNLVSIHGKTPGITTKTSTRDCQLPRDSITRALPRLRRRAPTVLRAQGHGVTRQLGRLRSAPWPGKLWTPHLTTTPPPPWEAREDGDWLKVGITCEPGEPGNALGDWEPLKIRGELHLHDAGHALQHHPCRRRPFLS